MKNRQSIQMIMIQIVYILALAVVVIPLLMIAKYNYPTADDWSYGSITYHVIKEGGNFADMAGAVAGAVRENYFNWEGRYSNVLFALLQPGIWGENNYGITAWIMLGGLIVSEIVLVYFCLAGRKKQNKWLCLPIVIPVLIMQILYVPYPVETFYWYTGSMNYTFMYALSLILIVLFLKASTEVSKGKYILTAAVAFVLAIIIGGNNFATSLSCFLTLCVLSLLFMLLNRKALLKTWFITLAMGTGLMVSVLAPANARRLSANFGGETRNAVWAIFMSLVRSFTNIYSWTNIKVILMIILIMPFIWKAVKNLEYRFRFPGLFTLISFGLYASQCTATIYVDGTTGGCRMADILFYSYYIWLVGNVYYWAGWLQRRIWKENLIGNKGKIFINRVKSMIQKYILSYCLIVGILLMCVIYFSDCRTLTSYKAYRNWKQGWAQQYAQEWEERLKVLRDENVRQVVVKPLTVCPEMLFYTDLQEADGYYWVNDACALYYDKECVDLDISGRMEKTE